MRSAAALEERTEGLRKSGGRFNAVETPPNLGEYKGTMGMM